MATKKVLPIEDKVIEKTPLIQPKKHGNLSGMAYSIGYKPQIENKPLNIDIENKTKLNNFLMGL